MMTPEQLAGALEAILMVAEHPVPVSALAQALPVEAALIERTLEQLAGEYRGEGQDQRPRGFELRRSAAGWRIYSAPAYAEVVERFVIGSRQAKLSQAAWETLAIVAYRQPVTRAVIASIRGVAVDGVIRTLLGHDLIEEAGQTAAGALTYRTTALFAEQMGLASLSELPPLAPYLPDADQLDEIDRQLEDTHE